VPEADVPDYCLPLLSSTMTFVICLQIYGRLLWLLSDADMTQITIHILQAQKKITAHSEWLQSTLANTYVKAKRLSSQQRHCHYTAAHVQ